MYRKMLIMDPLDNVGIALEDVQAGDICRSDGTEVEALQDIVFCHKIALCDIAEGTDVLKYGQKIGAATHPIKKGQWVHRHNVESERGR